MAMLVIATAGCADLASHPAGSRSTPSTGTFAPIGPTEVGRVVHVSDGDTVHVEIDGREERLRYIGIDTPERAGPDVLVELQAMEATIANTRLVDGREVVLERDTSETDRYDRLLRYVWLAPDLANDDTGDDAWRMVNLELVRMGLAEAVEFPPDVRYASLLEAAESEARSAGRSIWADP